MTQQVEFCGHTCMAARKLGFGLRANGKSFEFIDPLIGKIIRGEENPDQFTALENACKEFIDHLNDKK